MTATAPHAYYSCAGGTFSWFPSPMLLIVHLRGQCVELHPATCRIVV
jgi:hypothetical protein